MDVDVAPYQRPKARPPLHVMSICGLLFPVLFLHLPTPKLPFARFCLISSIYSTLVQISPLFFAQHLLQYFQSNPVCSAFMFFFRRRSEPQHGGCACWGQSRCGGLAVRPGEFAKAFCVCQEHERRTNTIARLPGNWVCAALHRPSQILTGEFTLKV